MMGLRNMLIEEKNTFRKAYKNMQSSIRGCTRGKIESIYGQRSNKIF